MQGLRSGSRGYFTEQQVRDVLAFQGGGKIRWGVDTYDAASGVLRTEDGMLETASDDWSAGTLGSGLSIVGDTLTT